MTKLSKKSNGVYQAMVFRETIGRTSPSPETLYVYIGKSSQWANESNPPTPKDSISEEYQTRADFIAIKKVSLSNICLVIPKVVWESGVVYTQYNSTDEFLYSKNFYVLTTQGNVYKCLSNNNNTPSIVEPTGQSIIPLQTSDGYVWKFMYDISVSLKTNFQTTEFIPVPTGDQKTSIQLSVEAAASYDVGSPSGGHGSNAANELGANRIMISQQLNGSEDGEISVDISYRQFGVLKNPRLIANNVIASGNVYKLNSADTLIDKNSGYVLTVENVVANTRSTNQAEKLQIVLKF